MSVRSFLIAATTWYSGFYLLPLVTRFACDISQYWQKFGFKFHLRSSLSAFSEYTDISYPASRVPFDLSGKTKTAKKEDRRRLCSQGRYQSTSWILHIACYTALTRPSKIETAVHGCNSWLSVWLYHVVAPLKFLRSISLASLFTKKPYPFGAVHTCIAHIRKLTSPMEQASRNDSLSPDIWIPDCQWIF